MLDATLRPREPRRRPRGDGGPRRRVGRRRLPRSSTRSDAGSSPRIEALQARRNEASKEIGGSMQDGQARRRRGAQGRGRARSTTSSTALEPTVGERVDAEVRDLLLTGPNLPDASVPVGADETENVEIDRWGTPPRVRLRAARRTGTSVPTLGIIDFERAVKLAESRFVLLGGDGRPAQPGAHQLHARHARRRAATRSGRRRRSPTPRRSPAPASCPSSRTTSTRRPTGSTSSRPPRCSSPTSTATRCSRAPSCRCTTARTRRASARRPGSAGRDTRGMIRVHQFDKVELVKFATPETSFDELEGMVGRRRQHPASCSACRTASSCCAPATWASAAAKTYDLEVWLPCYDGYKEISSLQQLHRLPGAPRLDQVPRPGRVQGLAVRAHAQRQRARGGPHARRRHRELPARRRQSSRCPRCCARTWAARPISGQRCSS